MTYEFLQNYWWVLIALLGGLLVALMFVQGANYFLISKTLDDTQKRLIVNSTGRKWELTFTTLVTFGGAFFASFPLFYSTSFGGAYWVWVLLLFTFVFQAVSYEFQHKKENLLGVKGFRTALIINGLLAPLIIGTAVGTFFTGSDFVVNKMAITISFDSAISSWGNGWHGLEALTDGRALCLGAIVMMLTIILGAQYLINNVDDEGVVDTARTRVKISSIPFVICFLIWATLIFRMDGYAVAEDGSIVMEKFKYFHNLTSMPIVLVMLITGVVLILISLWLTSLRKSRKGIWYSAPGTVLVVMSLFFLVGFGGTAYYPSSTHIQSSLTIQNSSSSYFTLKIMTWVSMLIPFVLAYIVYAWRQMNKKRITKEEINETEDKY